MRIAKELVLSIAVVGIFLAVAPAFAAWQTPGSVGQVAATESGVEVTTTSGARVRVAFLSPDTVRVRMIVSGDFPPDHSYAVDARPYKAPRVQIDDAAGADRLVLSVAGGARVVVHKQPVLSLEIDDSIGEPVVVDDPERPMAFDPASGAIEVSKRRDASELYYGFGEKALPGARHGQYMTMWNSDTPGYVSGTDPLYQTIPFFIALRGGKSYGLFFDNTYRSHFDMGKTDPTRYAFGANGGELDYYVFTGGRERSPANVLAAYTALTGRSPLPPLWALGYQQSRYSYTPQARVREVARTFRDKHIPADVIYLDIGYMDGYRIFSWSPTDFPQPRDMLKELHAEDFHVVTIVDPGVKVDDTFAIYRDGRARGVYTRDASGRELHAVVWPGMCAFPDFTDPGARAWFGSLYATFLDDGVDGFWNDMNEPATFPPPDPTRPLLQHDARKTFPLDAQHVGDGVPGTHAQYHNVYGMQMARATFEGLRRLRPDARPLVLTRAGYAGVQRYSAVWTGDNVASWEHLALSIPMLTGLSVSGVPFVGADVGGFVGSPSAELYTRWLQAAALTPFFRTHAEINSRDREPWSYGEDFERINRATIELRYRLLPYLYTLFAAEETTGMPPLRPLWFDHPGDVAGYQIDDEYLVGRDLLVAPVVHEGRTARDVYFPAGAEWIDWWDGTRHAGGSHGDISAPLDRLPLFVRAGAVVPAADVAQDTRELLKLPLTLVVALGADGEGSAYQDAGNGYAYRKGGSRMMKFTLRGDGLRIQAPASTAYPAVGFVEFLGIDASPSAVRADGVRIGDVHFDAKARRLRVAVPAGARQIALQR